MPLEKLFDVYTFRARLLPAAVAVIAPVCAIASWLPLVRETVMGGAATASVLALLVGWILAQMVGNKGRELEPTLWAKWGGPPTTRLLRHSNATVNRETRHHYHRQLERLFPDTPPPSAEDEAAHRENADARWSLITERLRGNTRDTTTFSHLFSENCQYGAWRNLFAIRKECIIGAVMALLIAIAHILYVLRIRTTLQSRAVALGKVVGPSVEDMSKNLHAVTAEVAKGLDDFASASIILSAAALLFFVVFLRERSVRVPADRYALRLIESAEILLKQRDSADAQKTARAQSGGN